MRPALEIAKRELRENVATLKLPLATLLVTLLLLAGVASLAAGHRDAVDSYELVQDEHLAQGRENTPEALAHRFLARPNALSLLVGGPGENVRASVASAPVVTNESARERQDPVGLRFTPTDLGTVGVGVLSLLAILVAYDAVSGEKERGTLKLLLINPLGRRDVLVGKYLGAMATLLVPLGIALLLALVPLYLSGIRFGAGDYGRLLLILGVLLAFLSSIVLLAIAVSSLTTRSSVAILALSLLWLLLVAGAGSVAAFAATSEPEGRSADELLREMRVLHQAYDERAQELARDIAVLEQKNATQNGTLGRDDAARLEGLRRERDELPRLREQDQQTLLVGYLRGRELDLREAERIAALSPAEAFRSAAQRLARTDYEAARDRLDEFGAYLRELQELKERHVADGGNETTFQPPALRSVPAKASGDLARASPFLVALALQNAAALALAVVAFARYDVR